MCCPSVTDITRIALSLSLRIRFQPKFNLEKAVTEHIDDVQSQTSPPQIITTPARATYLPSSSYKTNLSIEANLSPPEPAGTRIEQTAVDRLIWRFGASLSYGVARRGIQVRLSGTEREDYGSSPSGRVDDMVVL